MYGVWGSEGMLVRWCVLGAAESVACWEWMVDGSSWEWVGMKLWEQWLVNSSLVEQIKDGANSSIFIFLRSVDHVLSLWLWVGPTIAWPREASVTVPVCSLFQILGPGRFYFLSLAILVLATQSSSCETFQSSPIKGPTWKETGAPRTAPAELLAPTSSTNIWAQQVGLQEKHPPGSVEPHEASHHYSCALSMLQTCEQEKPQCFGVFCYGFNR